jgi:hypothetical protein
LLGLVKGEVYVVESVGVYNFSSYVKLKEFPGQSFNTVMFEDEGGGKDEYEMKPPKPKLYYIRSHKHDQHDQVGSQMALWWCSNSNGYTYDLARAGTYTEAEALDICGPFGVRIDLPKKGRARAGCATPNNIAYPVEMVMPLAMLTANKYDIENARLGAIEREKEPT